jgi:IS605 OrfB family transposase
MDKLRLKRAILLQTLATDRKNHVLKEFMQKALAEYNLLLTERDGCSTFMQFHHKTLTESKQRTDFNVQVRCSLIRDAYRKNSDHVDALTVKFNIPRNCKTFRTKTNFFIELRFSKNQKIAVPIKQNNNYQRFCLNMANGWACKTFGLTRKLQLVAYLQKEQVISKRPNVLGIDVNVKHFAVTVLSPNGKVLYQTYLGKNIYVKRSRLMIRRALLQSLNARKKLKQLRHRERNFVKTNVGQVVAEVLRIANKYNAEVAVENLQRFPKKGKKFNRKVMRMPFYRFKQNLKQRCFDHDVVLHVVDAYHTSKWCSHCGAVGYGHALNNYSLFKCKKCGQVVNSDRKASLAVAVKALLERIEPCSNQSCFSFQISKRQVPVSGLIRLNEAISQCSVNQKLLAEESPRF